MVESSLRNVASLFRDRVAPVLRWYHLVYCLVPKQIAGIIVLVTLVPFAILGAYILRVATIARQTVAYGPFIPEENDYSFNRR